MALDAPLVDASAVVPKYTMDGRWPTSSGPYPGPWMHAPILLLDTIATTVSLDYGVRLAQRHKKCVVEEVVG